MLAAQKIQRLIHHNPVLFFRDKTAARSAAAADMVIQAGPFPTDIPGQNPMAGAQRPQAFHQLQRLIQRQNIGIRTEIPAFVPAQRPRFQNAGEVILDGNLDVGILLVILQHRIIRRTVLFDQVIFQDQRFHFRIGHNIFKIPDQRYHPLYFGSPVVHGTKIRVHTPVQINSFAHINNGIVFVMHQINSRTVRQFFEFFLYVKHGFSLNLYLLCEKGAL